MERARLTARLDQLERDLRSSKEAHDMLSHHHDVVKKEVSSIINYIKDLKILDVPKKTRRS